MCLRLLGIICVAVFTTLPHSIHAQYECFFDSDFTNSSLYNVSPNDCDSNPGTFGVDGGRFTVNDIEGFGCNALSGNANNELNLNAITNLADYRNITLTFEYTIRDDSDGGFECTSVFGNGDDLIFMDVTVDGSTSRVNVFCEDTPGNINERKRVQLAVPDGASLSVTIFAGTQAPSEFFYFDRIRVCGNKIDVANPPVEPPPPPPVAGEMFQEDTRAVRCRSSNENLIPILIGSIYSAFDDGEWFDAEDNLITVINPSDDDLIPGENLFRYKLPDGNTSTFILTLIDNTQDEATLGPFCGFSSTIDLPKEINGYTGNWQGIGPSGTDGLELKLSDLQLGDNNEIAFTPRNSGCNIFFNVDVIDQFKSPTVKSCPPGVVNLLDSFPDLSRLVEEIQFEYLDDPSLEISDPQNVDISTFSNTSNEFTFIHKIPSDIGCRSSEVGLVVDANCPVQGDALSAVISINRPNGNICEGDCGTLSVDISGGTPPYSLKFRADIKVDIFGIPVPVLQFPSTTVTGDEYTATICSAPQIDITDIIRQNDIVFDAATNTWQIPTFITERGTIGGSVVDAAGTEVPFDNFIEVQAFETPDLIPNLQTRPDNGIILVCQDDEANFTSLTSDLSDFDDFTFYDGENGPEITDFSTVDLTTLWAVWANEGGCETTRQKVEYDNSGACNCTVAPDRPEFVGGISDTTFCNDGSFQGFSVITDPTLNLQYNWYDDNDILILANSDVFNPNPIEEGDFYVIAIDGNCPFSAPLDFSITFFDANSAECSTACVRPDIPELDGIVIDELVCDDGSFGGFRVKDEGFQYDWFAAGSTVAIERNTLTFLPPSEGDYYVNAVVADDSDCRSNDLNFSFNYYKTSITVENCRVIDTGIEVDITLSSGERVTRVNPGGLAVRTTGDTWRLLSLQEGTDYQVIITNSVGCETTVDLLAASYTCIQTCDSPGDNIGPISIQIEMGTSQIIDLTSYLVNATTTGIFLDGNNNPIPDPTAYVFTSDVVITHIVDRNGPCEDSVDLDFRQQGASIDGTVCADNVFCDEIRIILSSGVGSGAPYTMRFEMFDAAVIQEIEFEQEDLFNDTTLMVTVCVSGTENIYDANTKTLFIAEGTPAGQIRVQELRDSNGDPLGAVPPIDIDFSPLPVVDTINDIVEVCMFESSEYPIRDLNDQIVTSAADIIEWWYKQPSDAGTVDSDKVQADAAVNPNATIYALVISPDNCKVEVPVEFTIINDEFVTVAYDQFYCVGDPIIPTTLVDNGFDIDFDYSPRNGSSRINRSTGEITDAVVGTEYRVLWTTKGDCPAVDSTKITVIPAGDPRCSCPVIDIPVIAGTNVPAQPGLEGSGISYCFDDAEPSLIIDNNPGDLVAIWFTSRAETTEVFRGDEFLNGEEGTNYYVRFEDTNGCGSELTPIFTIRNLGQRLNTRNISICANDESSIDLTSFLVGAEGFIVDWFAPNGDSIPDPTNYDGAGVARNELLTLRQEYIDPDGCGDDTRVQFTITDYDSLDLTKFVCNAAEDFYTLEFEAPSHFDVMSDVGKVSESNGVFLVDSVAIGTDINLSINDNFLNCPLAVLIDSPSCNCDALPDPRDVDLRDTICFGDQFEIFDSNDNFTVNWYDVPSGGISISNDAIFEGNVSGTFYAEIIDKVSSCVSQRMPFVILDLVPSPIRGDINTLDLITCEELQDSFRFSNALPDYTVVWLDNLDRNLIIHEGDTFRPDEQDYPPGMDHEFLLAYQDQFGCISTVGQALTYRIYERPRLSPIDTLCSEDLRTVTFEFASRGADVLEPFGRTINANGNFEIAGIPFGEDITIKIGRSRTGVDCEIFRTINFDPANTCPCPDIEKPEPTRSNFKTVCSDITDFEFEVNDPNVIDVIAIWYDNEDGAGTPLVENSLVYTPLDSGAYYVQFIDTITGCFSDPNDLTQFNLFYDDVPNAGDGMDMTVCGMDSILLDTMLMAPINQEGFWNGPDGQLVDDMIYTSDYTPDVALQFEYIVVATNGQRCSDTLRTFLTVQAPFFAGLEVDLIDLCDKQDSIINLDDLLGPRSIGYWQDNQLGIDLNVDPVINTDSLEIGINGFTYIVDQDAVCGSETADIKINILPLPNVGVDTRDSICSGAETGYSFASALDGSPDLDGVWEDVRGALSGIDINANPGQVDLSALAAGDYTFRYSKVSGSCDDSAELQLHVRENNQAGRDTLLQICNTADLEVNFERILPDADEYDLSIDGADNADKVDFSVIENVDLSNLPSGQYIIRNVANNISACAPDDAIVTLVIEAAVVSPDIDDYNICYGDTIVLSDRLMVSGGEFIEFVASGALEGDTLYTARLQEGGSFNFNYVIQPDSICAVDQSEFAIILQSPPSAQGIAIDGSICQGDSLDLQTLLGPNTDIGGVFEDIEMTGGLTGSVLFTDLLSESNPLFSYTVGDGVTCDVDVAFFNVAILETPDLVDSIEFAICLGDGSTYDMTSELTQRGIDLTGEWLDPNGTGLDLSDPQNVGLSGLDVLTTYTIQYALSNGMCADTVDLLFQIDESLNAGEASYPDGASFLGHCEGDALTINLFGLLENEDQGDWFDENGVPITTAQNYDLALLAQGSYSYKHVVRNTNLQACPDDSVTIQILVEPAPDAGLDMSAQLCKGGGTFYNLKLLLEAGINRSGSFVDVNNTGFLQDSVISVFSIPVGTYEYQYVVETNTSCEPDIAVFTIDIIEGLSAGDDNRDIVCFGEMYDLNNLILNGDLNGRFEETASGVPITDNTISTSDYPVGELRIRYIVAPNSTAESVICLPDTANLVLDIRSAPDLGTDITDLIFCSSEASSINLSAQLGNRDQTGTWLDPTILGLDLTDPTAVDLSSIEPLVPSMLSYTATNAQCADTIDVVFTIDTELNAGEDIAPYEHCQGRTEILDLSEDLFPTAVDQGTWTIDGLPIPDPQDFDLKDLDAGDHILIHTVENTNLGVCPTAIQNVTITVYPAVSAGDSTAFALCQVPSPYDLLDLISDSADDTGVFQAVDDPAGLNGSQLLTTDLAEGIYEYLYIVSGSANCEPDSAILTLTIVAELDAGLDGDDMVCQGVDYDLQQFVRSGGGDPGGTFTNTNTGETYTYDNAILETDNISGTQMISYVLESENCDADEAMYELMINPSYDIMEEVNIAEGDSVLIDGIWRFAEGAYVIPGITAAGCDSLVTTTLTISDVKIVASGVSCTGLDDGMISVTVSAGMPPFNIQITQIVGGTIDQGALLNIFGTSDIEFLPEGEYAVVVTENTSGIIIHQETITIGVKNQVLPTIDVVDASCFGEEDGSLTISDLTVDGVSVDLGGYTYEWSSGDLTSSTGKLGGGVYQLLITDTMSNCPFTFEPFVGQPEALEVDTIISNFQCGDTQGSIELDLLSDVGGVVPDYSLDGGPSQSIGLFSGLEAGFYSVAIAYGNCTQVFDSLEVREITDNIIEIEPNDITLITGQEEEINVLINFEAINVEWSSYEGLDTTSILNPILTATETNDYIIIATDGFGCTVQDTLKVEVIDFQDPVPDIYIPNVFNPLASGDDGRFAPFVEDNYPGTFEMQVYNRWGNAVYDNIGEVNAPNGGWDGMYAGRLVEIGVYSYVIQFRFDNGTYLKRTGDVTVIY